MRRTLFKVCYWNEFTEREICVFKTTDYGEALKRAHTNTSDVNEVYVKTVMERPVTYVPLTSASTKEYKDD